MLARTSLAILLALQLTTAAAFGHHVTFTAYLSGPAESPPNNSPALGHAVVEVDFDLGFLNLETTFDGLLGTVTEAHIHAPTSAAGVGTAIVATPTPSFPEFPTGITAGDFEGEIDVKEASAYNSAFITQSGGMVGDAYVALSLALLAGKAYFDIHTTAFPDGEIRGFLSYVPGDYNLDGRVDTADYNVWRSEYGSIAADLPADFDENEVVDAADYVSWAKNIGRTGLSIPPGTGAGLSASIPEPSTFTLLALSLAASLNMRQRSRHAWL